MEENSNSKLNTNTKTNTNTNVKIIFASITLILTIAIVIALGSFSIGSRYASRNVKVLYISQSELLKLEKARMEQEPLKNRQLFFGKPKEATNYIENEQNRISKRGAIVLLTDSRIYGNNVRSISREVHNRIIKSLSLDTSAVEE